jgi:hypothetical protein
MGEKRRAKRMIANMTIGVSSLFKQDNAKISNIDAPIEVKDISRGGIGFVSTAEFPVGYYFNTELSLTEHTDVLKCVIKIIRVKKLDDGTYSYGAEFVGMPSVLSYIFEEYEEESQEVED